LLRRCFAGKQHTACFIGIVETTNKAVQALRRLAKLSVVYAKTREIASMEKRIDTFPARPTRCCRAFDF